MAGLLSLERRDEVAVVTLQRPEKRNALSIDLRVELTDAFGALGEDPEVGAIVLTGAPPAFCAGMDTSEFGGDQAHRELPGEDQHRQLPLGRQLPKAGGRRGQWAGRRRRLRAGPALRPATRR